MADRLHKRRHRRVDRFDDFARLAQRMPGHLAIVDALTGKIVAVSETLIRLTGWQPAELVGSPWDQARLWDSSADQSSGCHWVARSGQRLTIAMSSSRVAVGGRGYVLFDGQDVTAHERARLEYQAILTNSSIGIGLTRDRKFVQVNPKLDELFGYTGTGESLLGQPGRACWTSDEDYAQQGRSLGPRLARGETVEIVHRMMRRDGSTFLGRLVARAVDPHDPVGGGTVWLIDDITEADSASQALQKARDEAWQANRAKSRFLANVSHEIRTPLNGVLGLARLAQAPGLDASRRREYLEQIDSSATLLTHILGDLLDLSKMEAGKLSVVNAPFSLDRMLQTLHRGSLLLCEGRGLESGLQVDLQLPDRIVGDEARIRQILGNYLSNAAKFTTQGRIDIVARRLAGDVVRLEVRDTGVGLSQEDCETLFQPFTQVPEHAGRNQGGTGLGLAICRELAGLMDGCVGVDSEPGRGSAFWVQLPLRCALQASAVASYSPDDHGALLKGRHVLVADDNPVNILVCAATLESHGARVTSAENGAQAVALVDQMRQQGDPVELVLMDLHMPEMDGFEATARLRERFAPDELPIIALTAGGFADDRDGILAAGMNGLVIKPMQLGSLLDVLRASDERVTAVPLELSPAVRHAGDHVEQLEVR